MTVENMIPMNAIRAFDAVARHLSFSRAATELCVTQGAVSRQIANLERCLGVILFERASRKVRLTSKGAKLHAIVGDPLRRIRAGLRTYGPNGDDQTLKIKVPPTLGIRWFVPRLVKFHGAYPEIDVQITTSHQVVDFEHEDVDIAIHWGDGEWSGLSADFLIGEELIPVCSPELLNSIPINSPSDLHNHVLLQSMNRTDDWRIWREAMGEPEVAWQQVLKFENSALTYQAAIDQLGVVIAQRAFIEEDIAGNRLTAALPDAVPGEHAYYLVYPNDRKDDRKVELFRGWLLDAIANSAPQRPR
jgi:LysR family transcriptional regulator, glycine cleavage system transcriptional activator